MLHDLISARHDEIVARARARAALRSSHQRDDRERDESMPLFLGQLGKALQFWPARPEVMSENARAHGGRLSDLGFTVSQVVHSYGDVCQAVTELALDLDAAIPAAEFCTFNALLDEAMASALGEFERQRETTILRKAAERVSTLALAFQNALSSAIVASNALTSGAVSSNGSLEALLDQSLERLEILIDRPHDEAVGTRVLDRGRVFLHGVIREATLGASSAASRRGVAFVAALPDELTVVLADRQLLVAAVAKIVHHALQNTPPRGRVAVTVRENAGQALIEIESACDPLSVERVVPFGSALEQHCGQYQGMVHRLGPSVSASGGQLSVHDVPERGYVCSVVLQTLASYPCSTTPVTPLALTRSAADIIGGRPR